MSLTTRQFEMVRVVLLMAFAAILLVGGLSGAKSEFFHYETIARSLDDGHKMTNEIRTASLDSASRNNRPLVRHETQVGPSRLGPAAGDRLHSNEVVSGGGGGGIRSSYSSKLVSKSSSYTLNGRPVSPDQFKKFENSFIKSFAANGGFRRGFLQGRKQAQADRRVRARTVESPALSVDSGGGGASSRLANTISKVFRVEQGHYADIYNRIDNHKPLSTKRPAEIIDETIERIISPARTQDDVEDELQARSGRRQ